MTNDFILRARRAEAFLAHEDTRQAFADAQLDLFTEWSSCAWDEVARRERIHADQRALERLLAKFTEWANMLELIDQ